MTTTYDPFHPKYFDEADLRDELKGEGEMADLRSEMAAMEVRILREFGAFRDEIHRDRRAAQRQMLFVLVVAFVSLLVAFATG